jgi:hypothetical protein
MDSIESIRERLHRAERQLARARIARDADLNPYWLEKFSQGVIREPGYLRLSALSSWLDRWENQLPTSNPAAA